MHPRAPTPHFPCSQSRWSSTLLKEHRLLIREVFFWYQICPASGKGFLSDPWKSMRHHCLSAAIWCLNIIFMTPEKQLWNLQSAGKVTLLMACRSWSQLQPLLPGATNWGRNSPSRSNLNSLTPIMCYYWGHTNRNCHINVIGIPIGWDGTGWDRCTLWILRRKTTKTTLAHLTYRDLAWPGERRHRRNEASSAPLLIWSDRSWLGEYD